MRIALVHYTAPPVIGGVERILAEQAVALRRCGHTVDLVCGQAAEVLPQLSGGGTAPRYQAVIVHNAFTMHFDLALTQGLRELAQSTQHTTRWINWVHDVAAVNPHYAHLPWTEPQLQSLCLAPEGCAHVAVSLIRQQQYQTLTQLPAEQIHTVPNGVDVQKILGLTPRVADWVRQHQLWEKDYVIVHPTRLVRRKNIQLGLRITAALQKEQQLSVAYLITGAPDPHNTDSLAYAAELQQLVHELGLEHSAHFLGADAPLSDEDVRSLYSVSDALVFPSLSEGFGLPIVEAALHSVPVFCSDIPAHREIGQSIANFFDLEEDPGLIAYSLAMNEAVTARYLRRSTLASWLDWDAITQRQLLPLLQRA
jgi:mannosylglucosylglycerate synthase